MMDADDLTILTETAEDRIYHVYPVSDLREHDTTCVKVSRCWCNPVLQIEDEGVIIVHNSMDGREAFETGERKPS